MPFPPRVTHAQQDVTARCHRLRWAWDNLVRRGRMPATAPGERMNQHKIETLVHELLLEIGEDPQREGLVKTPQRVAAALQFLTSGYHTDAAKLVNGAIFTQRTNSMVIVKNIEVYSLCEHHMLPF